MATKNASNVTIYGRLSFPVFNYDEAVVRNAKSNFPAADKSTVTPEFNLLVEPTQLKKLKDHIINVFLPYCLEQTEAGEKRNALTDAEVKKLAKAFEAEDWDTQPPYIPIKVVPAKTQLLAPETVAMIKIKGNRGVNVELKAIVNSEDELIVPDPDLLTYPVIKPINQTVHTMYPGAYIAATLNLYAFISGKLPGISASAGTAVFKGDADRFGGGVAVDEDNIFSD